MALPETDLHRITLWCRDRVPEHLWDQVTVEADVSGPAPGRFEARLDEQTERIEMFRLRLTAS